MKTLIFSDSHLNHNFEEKKFNFLVDIISAADKVIIAGDFWEGYSQTFTDFVESQWQHLFTLLKEKETVYLYGNHDKASFSDERVSLFSTVQRTSFEFQSGVNLFHVEHGDRFTPTPDARLGLAHARRFTKPLLNHWDRLERQMLQMYGKRALKVRYQGSNNRMKVVLTKHVQEPRILVCGHTHLAEVDLKNRYVNAGMIRHGLGQYVVVEDGEVTPFEVWYD